jgi:hypothetical protein
MESELSAGNSLFSIEFLHSGQVDDLKLYDDRRKNGNGSNKQPSRTPVCRPTTSHQLGRLGTCEFYFNSQAQQLLFAQFSILSLLRLLGARACGIILDEEVRCIKTEY